MYGIAGFDGWMHSSGWGMSLYGWVVMTLVTALVVWVVWSIASDASHRDRSRELLDERYARGEIEREQYLEQRADLEQRPARSSRR